MTTKQVKVDYLFLTTSGCKRCSETDIVLEEAIREINTLFEGAGIEFSLERTQIDNKDKAIRAQLLSAPTIRVNGVDLAVVFKENPCLDCGEDCACDCLINCQVWVFDGKAYETPPKAMLVERLLQAFYQPNKKIAGNFTLSHNLEQYFANQKTLTETNCCRPGCC